jgi:hypothetical protein
MMKQCSSKTHQQGISRRLFLKRVAKAGAASIALPTLVPGSALGLDGAVAPSNRIVMAGIGLGGRGGSDLGWILTNREVQMVAICDVKRQKRQQHKATIDRHNKNQDCKMYTEMMDVLARPDIDAILTATSDRLHATVSIRAMRNGKDVYTEKPASMTIAEGQAVVKTARQYGRVYQAGMQRLSEANFIVCNELLRLGRLGEVKTVYAHLAPWGNVNMSREWMAAEPEPDADEVDWNRWLGPCPWRPYNKHYVNGGWHHQHDFYTSVIGEWGSHTFAQCHDALDMQNTSPVRYPYVPTPTADGMAMPFSNGVTMIQKQEGWRGTCGVRYVGSEGWCSCADGYARPEVSNPALLADYSKILQDYLTRTGHVVDHMKDFLACIKNRTVCVANPEIMHRSMSTVHCANIAQWLKRDLIWDPVKEEFVNDEQANRLRSRAAREGWQIV